MGAHIADSVSRTCYFYSLLLLSPLFAIVVVVVGVVAAVVHGVQPLFKPLQVGPLVGELVAAHPVPSLWTRPRRSSANNNPGCPSFASSHVNARCRALYCERGFSLFHLQEAPRPLRIPFISVAGSGRITVAAVGESEGPAVARAASQDITSDFQLSSQYVDVSAVRVIILLCFIDVA